MNKILKKKITRKKKTKEALAHPRTQPGDLPGALVIEPEAHRPVIRVIAYSPTETVEEEVKDIRQIKGYLEKFPVVWVNVDGLGDASIISQIGEVFNLHQLTLEDVVSIDQRPKVENYGDYLFIVARMVALKEAASLDMEQLSLFLGKNFVLTFQEHQGDCLDPVRDRIRKAKGRIRKAGPDRLAYALLDATIDNYYPALENYGERLENLEEQIMGRPDKSIMSHIHGIKNDLQALRRSMFPQREMLNSLLRDATTLVKSETRTYLRDCYDHAIQIMDLVRTLREMSSDLANIYLSTISNSMNEVMKVLTVIATIFIPLTFISGLYGMNFNTQRSPWNMPELNWAFGYPFAIGLMVAVAGGLLVYFHRKGWL